MERGDGGSSTDDEHKHDDGPPPSGSRTPEREQSLCHDALEGGDSQLERSSQQQPSSTINLGESRTFLLIVFGKSNASSFLSGESNTTPSTSVSRAPVFLIR